MNGDVHSSPASTPASLPGQGSVSSSHATAPARKRLRLYKHLDARFDTSDEDPRASLVNLVDVMLVFACGLIAAVAGSNGALKSPQPVEKGRQIERPADGITHDGSGYDRVGEVFRDPKTGKLMLIEPATRPATR